MAEVIFYHLTTSPLEASLPEMLERSLGRGWRVVLRCGSEAGIAWLDAMLWTYRDDSFLPHGRAGGEYYADQPVLIATDSANGNGGTVRFYVDRAVPPSGGDYTRIVYIFSGHDPDAVSEARVAWKALSAANDTTYWQQEPSGRWVKKA